MWTMLTQYNKNKETTLKNFYTITYNKYFSQRDKFILELCLSQSQLKKQPVIKIDTNKLLDDLGINRTTQNKNTVMNNLRNVKDLRITIQEKDTNKILVDFVIDIYFTDGDNKGLGKEQQVTVDFTQFNRVFMDDLAKQKKYLINLRTNEMLWMYEFFRIKVQQKNKAKKHNIHPYQFRYRSFKQMDILKWFKLDEEYKTAEEFYDEKTLNKIKHKITRLLRDMRTYALKNNLSFPTYRLVDGMYKVVDYNYKEEVNKIDEIKRILGDEPQNNSKGNSIR